MFKIFAKRPGVLVGILLGVGLLGTFWGSLSSSTFIAHESSILRLPLISWWRNIPVIFSRDFLMFSEGQFRPLSYVLLAGVRTFVGMEHGLFWHLWLLSFHGLNTILVFVLVRQFSKHLWSAGCAAAIFAFHPLSAVLTNNIDYFHYLLGLTFYLGAFWEYLSYVRTSRKRHYVGAMVWFVLGVLTSKVVFTLPLVLVAYEVLYRRSGLRITLARLLPFVVISLLLSPLYWFYKPHPLRYKYMEFMTGAGWYSFLSVVGATGRYAKGLVLGWDIPVVLHEVVEQIFRLSHWKFLVWGVVDLGILLGGGWILWKKRWVGLGVFLLFGALLPFASTSWNGVEEYVSWAYLYAPLVGWAFLVGGIADALWAFRREVRVGAAAILCLLGVYYGVQQVRLNIVSRSAVRYWTRVVRLHPNSELATLELGSAYLERGDREQALRFLFSPARKQLHIACLAMGRYYSQQGDLSAAAVHLRMAIREETGLQFQTCEMAEAELSYAAGAPDYAEGALGTVLTANPYNIMAMERLAEIWLFKGYVTAAYRLLDRAIEIAPSHPVVARMRTRLEAQRSMLAASDTPQVMHPPDPGWLKYVVRGVYDPRFRKELLRAGDLHRSDPVIQMEAAMHLLERGEYDLALSNMTQVTQSLSSCAYAWAMKCWVAAKAGAYGEAMAAGLRAQELDPKSPTAHGVLGVLFGKRAGARPGGSTGQRDLDEAIRHFELALRLDPRNAAAHANLGNLLVAQGKAEEAIEHYRQAVKINPALAGTHTNLGDLLVRQGKSEEAIEHYRQALRSRPDYVEVHTNLGSLLIGQGKLEEAIGHFRQALRLQPDHAEAYNNLGIALGQQGKLEEAIVHFRQAVHLRPDLANAYYNLGNLLAGQGKLEEAIVHFRQAVHLQPDHAEAYNNLAIALGQQGKLEEAIVQFRQAVRLRPTYAQAHVNLAMALMGQDRFGEGIRALREGLTHAPNHLGLSILLPWVLATCPNPDLRNGDEAVQLAERVCRATGYKVPQALNTLAAAYAEVGRFDEAIQQAQQALQLAISSGQGALSKQITARLKLYKAHRVVHEQP